MTEEQTRIITSAFYNLEEKKKEIQNKIIQLKKEKQALEDYNPLDPKLIHEPENAGILKKLDYFASKRANLHHLLTRSQNLRNSLNLIKDGINDVINFDLLSDDLEKLYDNVDNVKIVEAKTIYDLLRTLSQKSGVTNTITIGELNRVSDDTVNGKKMAAGFENANFLNKKDNYIPANSLLINDITVKRIKDCFVYPFAIAKKIDAFLDEADEKLSEKMNDVDIEVKNYLTSVCDAKLEDKKKKIENKEKEITKQNDLIKAIDDLYYLTVQHDQNPSKELFNFIIQRLYELNVLSERNYKKVTYKKSEKEVEIEENKEEKATTFAEITQPEINSDYFRKKDTLRIICFLGTDGDSIVEDIDSFDKSMKVKAYKRLNHIFDRLVFDENHIARTGGDPDGSTSKFTLTLLDTPFNFTYRRYGESEDRFRFHAIRRHSNLLEQLGYGRGDLVFFGAAGTYVDNEKSRVYNEVGSRAVKQLKDNNRPAELQDSFKYIEHITRGYIPVELLSISDKSRNFSGKAKGGIEKSIEFGQFVLYSELSEESKKNVKKWLDDYFIEQTNKLFSIKEMNKTLKGTSLD